MKRLLVVLAIGVAGVVVLGAIAWRVLRAPPPEEILARLERPPSPVRSPEQAREAFRVSEGFRVELVAAEPLVVDPVAIDWDEAGRLYVVEMRGFMPDLDGTGEDRPVGRVVVLEDENGDGRMDSSRVFLDGLVLPRAIAVLPEGVLIGMPGGLILCRDGDADLRCDAPIRLGAYAVEGGNPEHQENGLLPALDGWLYNAKSRRRMRLRDGALEVEATLFRGQWGIAQDDEGLLYYNHNSGFLYADLFPGEHALRQPAAASATTKPGLNVPLAEGELVWGVRVAPGLNRAYVAGSLRPDGRQAGPTAVSGIAIQRGDQYGPDAIGDAFVPESAGSAVARFAIERDGKRLRATHRLDPDPDWGRREFLASSDERFRPVDAAVGPDGAIWVVDMYRGVIQHAHYVSAHLRRYVEEHGLAPPGATGRIWRVVRGDRPIERRPPPLDTPPRQLAALDHPNGWVRDRAQRRLIHEGDPATVVALRALDRFGPKGRLHALWTLAGLEALDDATWRLGTRDADPAVRRAALRAGEPLLARAHEAHEADGTVAARAAHVAAMVEDADAGVRLQALLALGALPAARRPIDRLVAAARRGGALERQALVSALSGLEQAALDGVLAGLGDEAPSEADEALLAALAGAAFGAAQAGEAPGVDVRPLLDRVASRSDPDQRRALLAGIAEVAARPGSRRVELAGPHPLFRGDSPRAGGAALTPEVAEALARVRPHVTWPGDPRPGGARPLTPEEEALRREGEALYAATCATCHGVDGAGLAGLAPPLVGSRRVRDADGWLVRIVLHGLTGPIRVGGERWNGAMPGHDHDPRFDDAGVAGLLTHLRRAWGHGDDPVAPGTVAAIRAEEAGRQRPWTAAELEALPVEHRLDRYVGRYKVPILPVELQVRREGVGLEVGRANGPTGPMEEVGPHAFAGEGLTLHFETDVAGRVIGARFEYQGSLVNLARVD